MRQCFLSAPALIYLVMVPMWTRAWRFANVYAYAVLDILFAILWFAAFVAVATWNDAGISKGDSDADSTTTSSSSKGTCADFGYGSATKCDISRANVGLGVIIWLLFIATSVLSVQAVLKYRRTGVLPNGSTSMNHGKAEQLDASTTDLASKDPWATDIDDEEAQHMASSDAVGAPFATPTLHNTSSFLTVPGESSYGAVPSQHHDDHTTYNDNTYDRNLDDDLPHPGRQLSYGSSAASSVYRAEAPPVYDEGMVPSALSPTHGTPGMRLDFPEGRYDVW